MTLNDLKEEVAILGFETDLENADAFNFAFKRAIRTLYSEYDVIGSKRFQIENKSPSFHIEKTELSRDEIEFQLSGLCYSFTSTGIGLYTVISKSGSVTKSFSGDGIAHRGFIEGGSITIRFYTNYTCTVYDLAAFDKLYGQALSDIPLYCPLKELDLTKTVPDISSLLCPPKDDSGNTVNEIRVLETKLFIPIGFSGAVNITYKKSAPALPSSNSTNIDIPHECEHLLALLIAFYVWLDDDPEKANVYISLFRDGLKALKYYKRNAFDTNYHDVVGWA